MHFLQSRIKSAGGFGDLSENLHLLELIFCDGASVRCTNFDRRGVKRIFGVHLESPKFFDNFVEIAKLITGSCRCCKVARKKFSSSSLGKGLVCNKLKCERPTKTRNRSSLGPFRFLPDSRSRVCKVYLYNGEVNADAEGGRRGSLKPPS